LGRLIVRIRAGSSVILLVALVCGASQATAQDKLPNLEPISSANVERLQELARWQAVNNGFVAATFGPDGQTLALALNDGTVRVLNSHSLKLEQVLTGADTAGYELHYSPDGSRLLVALYRRSYYLWDIKSGKLLNAYSFQPDEILRSIVDPTLKVLALQHADQTVEILDLDTGKERTQIGPVRSLPDPQLSPGGSFLITADEADNVQVWDTLNGKAVFSFRQKIDGDIEGIGFSPDGTMIWANWHNWLYGRDTSDNQSIIQFWDASSGDELFALSGSGAHHRMYFDPTGKMIATAGVNDKLTVTIWVWNLETKQLIGEAGNTGGSLVDFSPDGQLLATASGSAPEVLIWDATMPEILARVLLNIESGSPVPPKFSSDGHLFLTVGADVRLWGVPIGK
jgi:WD40 repeat protein